MRRTALIALIGLAMATVPRVAVGVASAHLPVGSGGLVAAMGAADAMLVARVQSPTREASSGGSGAALTAMEVETTLAGPGRRGTIEVAGATPVLRYAAGERVLVFLRSGAKAAGAEGAESPQVAGGKIPLTEAPAPGTLASLGALWAALHPPARDEVDPHAVTGALVDLLRGGERKLSALALLDLAAHAPHRDEFSPKTIAALKRIEGEGTGDPTLRPAVAGLLRALGEERG